MSPEKSKYESSIPDGLFYTESHEWVRREGEEVTIGISDYAQHALGDIVFVELPEIGKVVSKGDPLAVVESVKAAEDVYTPVGGEVTATNESLEDDAEKVNRDPYQDGWFLKLRLSAEADLDGLLDAKAYALWIIKEEEKN